MLTHENIMCKIVIVSALKKHSVPFLFGNVSFVHLGWKYKDKDIYGSKPVGSYDTTLE